MTDYMTRHKYAHTDIYTNLVKNVKSIVANKNIQVIT